MSSSEPISAQVETKIGRRGRLGRRLRTVARRITRPGYDGDGDGFTMNPATGRDDLPYTPPSPRSAPTRNNNGWPDDDDDAMNELLSAAGVSRRPGQPQQPAPKAPEPEPNASEPRKRFEFDGISKRDVDDFYFDVFEAMKDMLAKVREAGKDSYAQDADLRDRKRLVKLHLWLKELSRKNRLKQEGDKTSLDLTEEDLKRLYKGFESMFAQGYWDDNEKARAMFEQLKTHYRARFDKYPDAKAAAEDIATKAINRRLARRTIRSARQRATARGRVSRVRRNPMDRPEYDGDNDGFITNPLTGRDEIPWARGRETAEEAINRFFGGNIPPSIADMVKPIAPEQPGRQAARPARRVIQSVPIEGPLQSYRSLGTYMSAQERLLVLRTLFGQRKIKDREWEPIRAGLSKIENSLASKYGPLNDLADFEKALATIMPAVKFDGWDPDLSPSEHGFLSGLLYIVSTRPDLFSEFDASIYRDSLGVPGVNAEPFFEADALSSMLGVIRVLRTSNRQQLFINYTDNFTDHDGNIAMDAAAQLMDTVPSQAAKAYIKSGIPQGTSDEKAIAGILRTEGLMTGLHEGGHLLHFVTSRRDVWTESESDAQIEARVDAFTKAQADELADAMLVSEGIKALEIIHYTTKFLNDNPGLTMGQMYADIQAETDPIVRSQLEAIFDRVAFGAELVQALTQSGDTVTETKVAQVIDDMIMGREGPRAIDALATEDPALLLAVARHAYNSRQPSPKTLADIKQDRQKSPNFNAFGLFMWQQGQMWDGLSQAEIAAVRKVWKYFSSYAKDKNSYYGGSLPQLASVEGIAELISAVTSGVVIPNAMSPEAQSALAKLRTWLLGNPAAPASKTNHTPIASKDVYVLLSMRSPNDV